MQLVKQGEFSFESATAKRGVPNKVTEHSELVSIPSQDKKFSPIIHGEYAVMHKKGGGLYMTNTVPLTQINSSNVSNVDVQSKEQIGNKKLDGGA